MCNLRQFHASSNGDEWLLGSDPETTEHFVLHRANAASGGHEARNTVDVFLAGRSGPEQDALRSYLERARSGKRDETDTNTLFRDIAEEYIRLGGRRRANVDDDTAGTQSSETESSKAAAFWNAKVEPLDDKRRREVEMNLPSISDD